MIGFTIISKRRLKELERHEIKYFKTIRCRDWFSGWRDLDLIWNYIFEDVAFGGIDRARYDYAKARGTTEYGESKPKETDNG